LIQADPNYSNYVILKMFILPIDSLKKLEFLVIY
jgi:hypothetical protein